MRLPESLKRGALKVALIVVATLMLVQLYDGVVNLRLWRATTNDPSARDAYFTFLEIDVVIMLLYAVLAWLLLYVLRRSLLNAKA